MYANEDPTQIMKESLFLQNLFLHINFNDISFLKDSIKKILCNNNIIGYFRIIRNLVDILSIRPLCLPLYCDILKFLFETINNQTDLCCIKNITLKCLLLSKLECNSMTFLPVKIHFLSLCHEMELFSTYEIANYIYMQLEFGNLSSMQLFYIYHHFFSSIKDIDYNFSEKLCKFQKIFLYQHSLSDISKILDQDPVEIIIKKDDLESLKSQNLDPNSRIHPWILSENEILQNYPTIFMTAIYYSSSKCLQYLQTKKELIDFSLRDNKGYSVEYFACVSENLDLLKQFYNSSFLLPSDSFQLKLLSYTYHYFNCYRISSINNPISPQINLINEKDQQLLKTIIQSNELNELYFFLQHTKAESTQNFHPLHIAAEFDSYSVLSVLLENTTNDINEKDENGNTALHIAVQNGSFNSFSLLILKRTIDMNIKNNHGLTAFHIAVQNNNIFMVHFLLTSYQILSLKQFNPNITDPEGNTVLHIAIKRQSLEMVQELLKYPFIQRNVLNDDGEAPIHIAVNNPGVSGTYSFTTQISPYTEINIYENPAKYIIRQQKMGSFFIVVTLVSDAEVDINILSKDHMGAVHIASRYGRIDYLIALKKNKNFDSNLRGKENKTSLHFAAENGNLNIITFLLLNEVQINAKDDYGNTSLHLAAKGGHFDCLKYLASHYTTILDEVNNQGRTALHLAAISGSAQCLRHLLTTNIDQNKPDINGITALQYAYMSQKNSSISAFFKDSKSPNSFY